MGRVSNRLFTVYLSPGLIFRDSPNLISVEAKKAVFHKSLIPSERVVPPACAY